MNYDDCDKNCAHPAPGKIFLKRTNSNTTTNIINLAVPPFTQTFNQPIASVTIDTTCLCKPELLIKFKGILTTTAIALMTFTSTFTLYKICKKSKIRQPVATYNFNLVDVVPFPNSQTIMFDYTPCGDQCEDYCTYILEFTRASSSSNLGGASGSITISSTLSVLGLDSSN